jgi:hypothetical protein
MSPCPLDNRRVWSLISDKFTPSSNEGQDHPSDKHRRMKYIMNTKEPARLTIIKGAIDGVYTMDLFHNPVGYRTSLIKG